MRKLAWVLLVAAAGSTASTAFAAPDPKLLAKGRELEARGQHAEAVAQFEAYLQTAPDDPIANAELGFAALQAKDLIKAEAATRKAIAKAKLGVDPHDPDGRGRGAALYNLGLILEAQGKPKEAAAAYQDSLAARSSRWVRERLQRLDPELGAAAGALAPRLLAGPFKDVKELCAAWLAANGEPASTTWGEGGSCAKPDPIRVGGKLAKPFLELQVFQLESRENLEVAVRLARGWYHFEYVAPQARSAAHCGGTTYTVKPLPVASAPPQLQLEYHSVGSCDHGGNGHSRSWGWDETGVVAIGIGPSGKPAAPRVLVQHDQEWEQLDDHPKTTTEVTLQYSWGKGAALDVSGNLRPPPPGMPIDGALDADDFLGHHLLVFP